MTLNDAIHAVQSLTFLRPDWLLGIPVALGLGVILWFWCGREFHRRLALFVSARLRTAQLTSRALLRKRIRLLLVTLAMAALCVALARPLGGVKQNVADRKGVNVLIALDGSRSMGAEDVKPNRFALAQHGIETLLQSMKSDRAGLLVFAGESTLNSPLSFDTVSLEVINRGLSIELAGKGGSSISKTIERATEFFNKKAYGSKVLIILSDGEETEGDAVIAAQQAYQKYGIRIFTVGVGTVEGSAVPRFERNADRNLVKVGVVHDPQGKEVLSRLDDSLLQTVGSVAGGTYTDLQAVKGDLSSLYTSGIQPLAGAMEEVQLQDLEEWFQIPLAAAVLLMMLEMLIPNGRSATQKTRAKARAPAAVKAVSLLALAFIQPDVSHAADSSLAVEARRLFQARDYPKAFKLLQQQLLKTPEDELANYNYALAAYAAGKHSVAIERFEKLAQAADPKVQKLSQLQLGNALYRQGEQMLAAKNPEGAVIQWQKALAAYQSTDGEAAVHNHAKVLADLLALLNKLARAQERTGDEEARLSPDKGIPGWQAALGYLDQAVSIVKEDEQGKTTRAARGRVADKIFSAHIDAADDNRRRAELQKETALEMAIEQMQAAVTGYESALAVKPDNKRAAAGKAEATKTLNPWLVELADQHYREGQERRSAKFWQDAVKSWQKAGSIYAQVLEKDPANAGALRGQERNNNALHDGYVALGDEKQQQALAGAFSQQDKDAMLEEALGLYQSALTLQPTNAATEDKLMKLGRRLTGRFVERGQGELASGKKIAAQPGPAKANATAAGDTPDGKTAQAIAWVERSVQSFGKALRFDEKNPPALAGKAEADALLRKLREEDSENQRQNLAKSKMNNAQDMDDPGKKALKLLDYDTDQAASKKQQSYVAPEDRSVKDW